ncbi:hypothetical protein ESOMN_v1c06810 [Williamsoniiplasma somnilux]|uniref:Uncharacterized protein n=1 Tax=Williamsoniiplasma somnilux TaxID=215578 RepID=A0A2K8P2E5_9MOLU|nr:hypothetical protein [Williamsoniiplasma somnilux]ATZ19063.1 hypothetical protein ESOMN_v1c06810 [Williamsoniiplasma somnilux]
MKKLLVALFLIGALGLSFGAFLVVNNYNKALLEKMSKDITNPNSQVYKILKNFVKSYENEKIYKEKIDALIVDVYGENQIDVAINETRTDDKGKQKVIFTGLRNNSNKNGNFSGVVAFDHEWNINHGPSKDLEDVKNDISKIIETHKDKKWDIEKLEKMINNDSKFKNQNIKVETVAIELGIWNHFQQILMISTKGNSDYFGAVSIKHDFKENEEINIGKNETIKEGLTSIINNYDKNQPIDETKLQDLVDNLYGKEEIQVSIMNNETKIKGKQNVLFKGLHSESNLEKKYSGQIILSHDWEKKETILLETERAKIENILKSNKDNKWDMNKLQEEIKKINTLLEENIEVKEIGLENNSWNNFEQIILVSVSEENEYSGSLVVKHKYKEDKSIDIQTSVEIKNALETLVKTQNSKKPINQTDLQSLIDNLYGKEEIIVEIKDDMTKNMGSQIVHFKGMHSSEYLNKKYSGELQISHNWNDPKSLKEVRNDIKEILESRKDKKWEVSELKIELNKTEKFKEQNIEVEEIVLPVFERSFVTNDQTFTFKADGSKNYIGTIVLKHNYNVDSTIDIENKDSEIYKTLNLIVESLDSEKPTTKEEIKKTVEEIYGSNELEIEVIKNGLKSEEVIDGSQTIKFSAVKKEDNSNKFKGNISFNHEWKTNNKVSEPIENIRTKLETILKSNGNSKWNLEELKEKIESDENLKNQNIVAQELAVETNGWNSFEQVLMFSADGEKLYVGSISLRHKYVEKNSIDISDEKNNIKNSINTLVDGISKTQKVDQNKLQTLINNLYGINEIKVEIEDSSQENSGNQTIKFTGLHSDVNIDKKYSGTFQISRYWNNPKMISEKKDLLQSILNKNNNAWTQEALKAEIEQEVELKNQNITVKEIKNNNTRTISNEQQVFLFEADKDKSYFGSIVLIHSYNVDTTVDISDDKTEVYNTIKSIKDTLDKTQKASEKNLQQMLDNIYGSGEIDVNVIDNLGVDETATTGLQTLEFIGLWSAENTNKKFKEKISFEHKWSIFKDISNYITELDLGEIEDNSPSTIKNKIIELNPNAAAASFEILDINDKTVKIKGVGNFVGEIELTFTTSKLNIQGYILLTNLGTLIKADEEQIRDGILAKNPKSKNFQYEVSEITNDSALITGLGEYTGKIRVTYQMSKDISKMITKYERFKYVGDVLDIFNVAKHIEERYKSQGLVFGTTFALLKDNDTRNGTPGLVQYWHVIGINSFIGYSQIIVAYIGI